RSEVAGFDVWRRLGKWEDEPLPDKPGSAPVDPSEARARLAALIGDKGEGRPEQSDYAAAAAYAFGPRERAGVPRLALIEAGTGTGKTLGYLAPASLWAERNGPGLWLSTYTRNLQRQIMGEIARLWPDPAERDEKAVVRKGRENYLCLLNFEEAVRRAATARGPRTVALGLVARWIGATRDGDLSGSGFPAHLAANLSLREITDRRGECIYAACPHYRTCFIEKAVRKARHAPIVIANHALVIAQAAQDWLGPEDGDGIRDSVRVRYVFDEGHHLFDAADSGFSAFLSGAEMTDLRRWIRGAEGRARSRQRGLEDRLKDLVLDHRPSHEALQDSIRAAAALAGEGWTQRLGAAPRGPAEAFLAEVFDHVRARSTDDGFYSLEADTEPLGARMIDAIDALAQALRQLAEPLGRLARELRRQMDALAAEIEPATRQRLDAAARGVERRGRLILPAWIGMLEDLSNGERKDEFVDWFEILREDGRDRDVGLRRHWVDPTVPFSQEVLLPAHGALITSATLRDADAADNWQSAEVRTGAAHLAEPPRRASFGSPFDYARQARIFIITDIARRDPVALASAYRELFRASGGGALGLFTAVRSLRAVEARIAAPLAEAGLTLYAQHVDRLDTGALVDLFRAEENACLLGTDALRDGVDVPGRSLRLVVFDKVPWPRPTILHRARRARFGRSYDDMLTRLRLKQAFGRLIRTKHDKGCFVILESATPSRLLSAFPSDVEVRRCGLREALREISSFVAPEMPAAQHQGDQEQDVV
ncbi:MAG: ATP-dependent DNA helicase, partial [Alphaproteobacteria bacterium]|nr:ATP-dependent DNA helicase [Alphaproteobacteria bacterium]